MGQGVSGDKQVWNMDTCCVFFGGNSRVGHSLIIAPFSLVDNEQERDDLRPIHVHDQQGCPFEQP